MYCGCGHTKARSPSLLPVAIGEEDPWVVSILVRERLFMIHVSNSLDDFCLWALCISIHHYGHWRGRSITHEWHPCNHWRGTQVIIHVSTSLTSVIEHYGLNSVWPAKLQLYVEIESLGLYQISSRVHWWSRSCSHWITSGLTQPTSSIYVETVLASMCL